MAKPRTPAKTTKARDGWPRYFQYTKGMVLGGPAVVRLDSKERGVFFYAGAEDPASPYAIGRCLSLRGYKPITKEQAVALFPRAATADRVPASEAERIEIDAARLSELVAELEALVKKYKKS